MVRLYQVGGFIRDTILRSNSKFVIRTGFKFHKDLDFAVEAKSYADMREYILAEGGKIYLETPEFFTIRARLPLIGDADFVLCRKESGYSDGRHPDHVEMGTIYDDLTRRDFTMNAIAYDVNSGNYIDPHNGMKDIDAAIIRAVGDAESRMNEDPLRLLRAIRFRVTLPVSFSIHPQIGECLHNPMLISKLTNTVSTDRIREEIGRMFSHNTYVSMQTLSEYPYLFKSLFCNTGIWLKPTTETRKGVIP
jgi:tRNA nucleotidyltransferase/poly(A) polymerase